MKPDLPLTTDELLELRQRLDEIDSGIIDLIAERQAVVTDHWRAQAENRCATAALCP